MGPPEMVKQTKGGTNIRPGIRIRIEAKIAMCGVIIKRWTDEERDMQQQQQWIEATTNAGADKRGYIQRMQAEPREVAPRRHRRGPENPGTKRRGIDSGQYCWWYVYRTVRTDAVHQVDEMNGPSGGALTHRRRAIQARRLPRSPE